MSRDVTRRNQSLYCSYHRDRRHITKDCRTLKDHLNQLEKVGYLKEFMVLEDPWPQDPKGGSALRTLVPSWGTIRVIHAAKKWVKTAQTSSWIMVVALVSDPKVGLPTPKKGWWEDESIGFTGKDLEGTVQPHEDALMVTLALMLEEL